MVFKTGGGLGNTDTAVALGLYGLNLATVLVNPLLYHENNLKGLVVNKAFISLSAIATTIAFLRINQTSGLIYSIYAAVATGCALSYYEILKMNSTKNV